jgi:hypothetical protein
MLWDVIILVRTLIYAERNGADMGDCAEPSPSAHVLRLFFKRPLVLLVMAGIIARAVLIPLATYNYDIGFWATTIQHAQSGYGLYDLSGYYYTPIWGYILGSIGLMANFLFGIGSYGTIADPLLPALGAEWEYYGKMVVSPEFSLLVKSFLTLVDVVCGYLIFTLVKKLGHSDGKAALAFGLWFVCPIVIYTSAVQATFDNVSIMFMLLTLILILDGKYMTAGAIFCLAAFTKFFPAYLVFIFVVCIVRRHEDKQMQIRSLAYAVIGFLVAAFLIFLPQFMHGTTAEAFGFVVSRVSKIADPTSSMWDSIASGGNLLVVALQPLIFVVELVIAFFAYRLSDRSFKDNLMILLLLSSAAVFLWTPTPTYLLLILPFLICVVAAAETSDEKRYILPLVSIAVTATLFAITMNSFALFFQDSIYHGLISPDTILNGIEWLDAEVMTGVTRQTVLNIVTGAAVTLSIYSVFITYIYNHLKGRPSEEGCA